MDYVEFGDVYLFHQRKNLQNHTIFERTSKKVSFPLMLSQEPGFAGLLQSKLHQIIYFIILQNEEGFYKKKGVCYCSICHDIRSANGGNYSHHAKRHEEEDPQLSREDEIEMLLVWAVSHNIPFSAFHDSKWRTVFHGWIAKEAHWDILNKFAEKIHELISSELEKAEFIEMSTDGWSCNHGRFQGIIAHTSGPEGATYPLAFLPSDTEIMGKEKIAELVLKTMNMFDINRQKVVGIVTDTTAENPAAAQLLELQWDPCYLHILSLAMQDFYPALPVPFKECLNSLSILAATAKFKDFKRAHIDEYPEISEKWRIQKGVPTRWCSYIKEMKSLLLFLPMIRNYIAIHHEEPEISFPNDFEENLMMILESLVKIEELTTKMESIEYNTNIANVCYTFSYIQNICRMFIHNSTLDDFKGAFQALYEALDARFFNQESESAKLTMLAAYLDPRPGVPEQIAEKRAIVDEYLHELFTRLHITPPIPPAATHEGANTQPNTEQITSQSFNSQNCLVLPTSDNHFWNIQEDRTLDGYIHYCFTHPHDTNPARFWASNSTFPELAAVAQLVFAHKPTTISNESWFSMINKVMSSIRQALTVPHLQTLAFLKGNQKLFEMILQDEHQISLEPRNQFESDET